MIWAHGIAVLLYNILAGSNQVFIKILGRPISPIFLTAIRMILGGFLVLFFCVIRDGFSALKVDKTVIGYIVRGALFRVFLPSILFFWAVQHMTVAKFALFFNLTLFISYLLSYLLLCDRMTWKKTVGLVIGFSSVIPLLLTDTVRIAGLQDYWYISLPEFASILGVTLLCYGWIDMKRLIATHENVSLTMISGYDMFVGGVFALLVAWGIGHVDCKTIFFLNYSSLLLFSVLLHVGSARILYPWLLRYYSQTFMALASRLMPVFAAITGWLCLGEGLSWDFPASIILTLLGLKIYHSEEFKKHR